MSVNLGVPFQEGEQASSARRNATMVVSAKGSEIASIPTSQNIPLFRSLSSESGYLRDELYFTTADGLSKRNIRRRHTHSEETDEEGGLFHNILIANPRVVVYGQAPFNNIYDYNVIKTGTAEFEYVQNSIFGRNMRLTSTWDAVGIAGNYVNAAITGMQIGFSEKILGIVKMFLEYNANQVARVGFGMEQANSAIDIQRKIGMEMCGGTGTNWQAVAADGVTRSTSATSMNSAPVDLLYRSYRFFFNPLNVSYTLTNTDGIAKIMTSTIPSGGVVDYGRLFRFGINTTNSTTKNMWVRRLFFVAKNADASWFSTPE